MKVTGKLKWNVDTGRWSLAVDSSDVFIAAIDVPCENLWEAFDVGQRISVEIATLAEEKA